MRNIKILVTYILLVVNLIIACPNRMEAEESDVQIDAISNAVLKETLISKSVEAFPEYEEKIRGENFNAETLLRKRDSGMGNVVYSETRTISSEEMVTYTEFDTGIALTAIGLMAGKNITKEDNYGTHTTTTMNVWLQCGASESILFISGFRYSIYGTSYDKILYKGTIDSVLDTATTVRNGQQLFETATSKAYVEYSGVFKFNINYGDIPIPVFRGASLKIEVGNNSCQISAY